MDTMSEDKDSIADGLNDIRFEDIFNLEDLQRMQDLFSDATGVASLITHPDGTPITNPSNFCRLCNNLIRQTEKGRANCFKSDALLGRHNSSGPIVQPCLSGGLWDAGASITVAGKHIANWLIGQVRNEKVDERRMIQYADEIGANREDFMRALREVPVMPVEQFNKVSKMLFAFANELSEKAYSNLQLKMQIDEREKATLALRESNELLSLFMKHSPIFAFIKEVTPTESRVLKASDIYLEMVGIPGSEMFGKTMEELFPAEFAAKITADDWAVVLGGKVFKIDEDLNGRNYTTIKYPLVRGGKNLLAGYTIDITERKQAEDKIRQLNKTLEQHVDERTKQLEITNEELAFYLKEIEQFTYIASHDLQEPLRTLTNFTQLIQEEYGGKLDEEGDRYIEFISSSANRMRALVRGLLDYSLLGKERVLTLVDCNKIVGEALSDMTDSIRAGNASITLKELPVIHGYATELRLLFQNLINNAIKFQKKEIRPVINISAENHEKEWIFKIQDNGIGIEDIYKEKIFIIFKRMHNRSEYEGTGIGLSHCKKIVELHGGRIWVESIPGSGSTFIFSIPKRNRGT
jgi:signal transduction histidine kinase/ligand-binding sensor protein